MKYRVYQISHSTNKRTLVSELKDTAALIEYAGELCEIGHTSMDEAYDVYPHSEKLRAIYFILGDCTDRFHDAEIKTSRGIYWRRTTRSEKIKFKDAKTGEISFVE